jgi:hypothetical protein
MPGWIIVAAVASIAITAMLTFVFWRLNAPSLKRDRGSDGGGGIPDTPDDGGSDGGGDGGGD